MENKTIENFYYKTEKIFDRVYRISSLEGTFLFLFVGDRKALLLDTAYGFGNLKKAVRKITDLPLIIVNSHGHLDHVCGNFQFDEDIYIHASDIELCKSHNSTESRQKIVLGAQRLMDFSSGKRRNALPEGFLKDHYIHQGHGKLVPLTPDHLFELGGATIAVHELPGHTRGSVGLEYREEGVLFTADAINPLMFLFLPESTDLATFKKTLAKANSLNIKHVVFSHSPEIAPKSILEDFIECAEQVDYDQGVPFEAKEFMEFAPRICTRSGFGPNDIMKSGFAAIIIDRSRCNN
jgi:glyoxylase-like metal-dependent hydrolase (beta-lactamase superfamily II)